MSDQSYPLATFMWHREDKTLSADASSLRWPVAKFPPMLRIKSHHTGQTESFIQSEIEKNRDGELEVAHYTPLGKTKVARVTIFND